MNKDCLCIVIPCYNEEKVLQELVSVLDECSVLLESDHGLYVYYLLVDDGSKDDTLSCIQQLQIHHKRIRYLSFSRNFGKEAAIYAGLQHADTAYTGIMDADLQDPCELLYDMVSCVVNQHADCAAARRVTRTGEPLLKSWLSRNFYKVMSRISDIHMADGVRDFRVMNRRYVDAILQVKEYNRFSKGIFEWIGFDVKWFTYENIERTAGESKWSVWKLFLYSLDGITAFSSFPLIISSVFGAMFSFLSILFLILIIIRSLIWKDPVNGWPSTICVITLIGGIQLLCIGVLGQYLSRTFMECKRRPIYILKDQNLLLNEEERKQE